MSQEENNIVEEAVDEQQVILDTMHGDLTKAFIEELRHAKDGWSKLGENDQDEVIERCKQKAESFIRRIFIAASNKGFESCTALVESVTFKDGVKVAMKTIADSGAHELADRTDKVVTIIFADPGEYLGGGEMPESEPDQGDLIDEAA